MYEFKTRFRNSAVIPALFFVVYLSLLLYRQIFLNPDQNSPFGTAWSIGVLFLLVLVGYLGSVLFFSVETIVRLLMTQKVDPHVLFQRIRSRSFGNNIEVLQVWDTKNYYQITRSIIFQTILLTLGFYAGITQSALPGRIMILSILFQMFADQGKALLAGSDIQRWYWQISYTIKRDTQLAVYLFMLLLYFGVVWINLGI